MPRFLGIIAAWVLAVGCGGRLDDAGANAGRDPEGNAGQGGTSYVPPSYGGHCFGKGTLIATATGSVAIENLHVGDLVQGFDSVTGTIVERAVTDIYAYPGRRVGLLQTAFGPLRVTPEHPIYDADAHTFVAAASLTKPFAALELASNWSIAPSPRGAFALLDDVETVYNLTVADVHTYFANGLLVHNKQPPCGSPGVPLCPCGVGGSCGGGGSVGFGGGSGAAGTNTGGMIAGAGGNGSAGGDEGAGGATGEGGAGEKSIDGGDGPGGGGGADGG